MRRFRVSVGNSLKGKVSELGFFLEKIIEITKVIEQRQLKHEFPLNDELDQLNFFFSAYLNTIQSLKDAFQVAAGTKLTWQKILPTYSDFVIYCRNATTHDGCHLINAGKEGKCYIVGPLRRIDNKQKVITFDPPGEDVFSLCCNLTDEILQSLTDFLKSEGFNIPVSTEDDFNEDIRTSLMSNFVPNEIKNLIESNVDAIEASLKGLKVDTVHQTTIEIDRVAIKVSDAKTFG